MSLYKISVVIDEPILPKEQIGAEEYIVNTLESIGYKVISTELREM